MKHAMGGAFDSLRLGVYRLASAFAIAGGLLLCGLAALVVVSIAARIVVGRPVTGDFELVAVGTAISIFLCLPYCQLRRANVTVDLFIATSTTGLKSALDGIAAALFALLAVLFTWRMSAGFVSAFSDRDVSVILGIPLWWAYPPAVAAFGLLSASCVVTAWESLSGRTDD